MTLPHSPLPADVRDAVAQGHTIEAVKLLRAATGLGLKEAKDAVEAGHQVAGARLRTHSPGEAPRASGTLVWVVALLVIAGAIFYYAL